MFIIDTLPLAQASEHDYLPTNKNTTDYIHIVCENTNNTVVIDAAVPIQGAITYGGENDFDKNSRRCKSPLDYIGVR